ncbi:MAG: replication-associated recombination protein A [Bacteroidia bacterium]
MNAKHAPLAERQRPTTLEEYIGQEHLIGPKGIISSLLKSKVLPSIILWGPPGVGKTTLAQLLAKEIDLQFFSLSAIQAGVKDVKNVIETSKKLGKSLLFIDEIHRFNKAQQDALLGAVENGIITLIGATTENPSFEVISALLSRCQVFVLNEFTVDELSILFKNAIKNDEFLSKKSIEIIENQALIKLSGGDARRALNLLELVVEQQQEDKIVITNELVEKSASTILPKYDKKGENHYDVISAFIKSIRGSDPNAAVYYLARMLKAGEDIKFIARRMIISASEDIGNANPNALVLANNCFSAASNIGMPEARIILSQCAIYLATSPKSNASYNAINEAMALVGKTGDLPIPLHLRNAPTKLMKALDYGKNYKYPHDFQGNHIDQEYLPEQIINTKLYKPGLNPKENSLKAWLKSLWKGKYGY